MNPRFVMVTYDKINMFREVTNSISDFKQQLRMLYPMPIFRNVYYIYHINHNTNNARQMFSN
jgi:hypothetical protein